MSSWKLLLSNDSTMWRGIEAYCDERIADLTALCIAPESADTEIRQAQASILELQRIKSLPATLAADVQVRQAIGARKEY